MVALSYNATSSIVAELRDAGCVFAEDEARLLIASAASRAELDAMVERRTAGHPIEHVLGWSQLCGVRIEVDSNVFVPRLRTELLIREAARLLRQRTGRSTVVDLCCGSGALGAVLSTLVNDIDLHAVDVDGAAVRCARRNIRAGRVYEGDLYQPLPPALRGCVDLVVANAPYVPSAEIDLLPREARVYEPRIALDGGPDGLDIHRKIIAEAPPWLRPGGHLLIETAEHQTECALEMFARSGFNAKAARSSDANATIIHGTRSETEGGTQ